MSDCIQAGGFNNILFCADSYKVTHHLQYPPNTTKVYSYFESRGGKHEQILFFGLQYLIKRWLLGEVVTKAKIQEAKELYNLHFGQDLFNEKGWMYIVEHHKGYLPIRIKAVPEGTVLPYKNVLFTVENTDPKCYWLSNYLETLLVQTWYPLTVATNSFHQKRILSKYNNLTMENGESQNNPENPKGKKENSTNKDEDSAMDNVIRFQLHDFGYRGASSVESASIGGLAHLVNFQGTDNIAALLAAKSFYHCPIAAYSIPAAEHSTVTTWGKDGEAAAFKHMLQAFPNGSVSVVSDSYHIFEACEKIWCGTLKGLVLARGKRGGRLVVRPDSGNPQETVLKVLDILAAHYKPTINSKGFKVLPAYIRVIQGDGVSFESLDMLLKGLMDEGWSSENLVFGSGGALLQRLDRDTLKCAFKCSYAEVEGRPRNVYKDPIGDSGKKSKKGKLKLVRGKMGVFETVQECADEDNDILEVVYENGKLLRDYSLDEVRKRAKAFLKI